MKLLMENWRKFLTEASLQHVESLEHAYNILGVERGDKGAAKTAFRNIAKVGHPDAPEYDPENQELFLKATEAWAVIQNPTKYEDQFRPVASPAQQPPQSYSGGMPDDILSRWAKAAAAQKARDDAAAKRGQEELRAYMAANPEAGTEPPPPTPIPKSEEDEDFAKLMAKLKYAGRSGGRR